MTRKRGFGLEDIFSVTRKTTQTWRKDYDAPSGDDAIKMAEAEGAGFENGATVVGRLVSHDIDSRVPEAKSPEKNRLLTIDEAAVRMNVTTKWLYTNWKRLKLGTKVSSRQVRIYESAVEHYLKMRQPS